MVKASPQPGLLPGRRADLVARSIPLIREQTKGRHSLDDFLRNFFGQRDTEPIVVPYTRADVESALSAVCPYDWHAFFETRVYQANSAPPTDGSRGGRLEAGANNETPNRDRFYPPGFEAASAQWYSIGASVKTDGTIADVLPATPADQAGLGPHMTILSSTVARSRLDASDGSDRASASTASLSVVVKNFSTVQSRDIQYAGGLRYPHLERIAGSRGLLTEILAARNIADR